MKKTISKISVIACKDANNGIGYSNNLPWNIKEERTFFNDITRKYNRNKNAVIMGKNTWLSLPYTSRSLPGRLNIVVSSTLDEHQLSVNNWTKTDTVVVNSVDNAISYADSICVDNIFIAGGHNIYTEVLKKYDIENVYMTKINNVYSCDTFFPKCTFDQFKYLRTREYHMIDKNGDILVPTTFQRFHNEEPNFEEISYLNLLYNIIGYSNLSVTRNGVTFSKFGETLQFDLSKGFPLLTTKNVSLYNIFNELIFFINGYTNTNRLKSLGVNIWNENTNRNFLNQVGLDYDIGDMGPMYGYQWRHFDAEYHGYTRDYNGCGLDQLKYCINLIKNDPTSRRIIMTSFNPKQVFQGCLFPCHGIHIQFNVENNKLDCLMTQRSADAFLGLPYNIASYALLVNMICEVVNNSENKLCHKLTPGTLTIVLGNVHIYESHIAHAVRQILRHPSQFPKLGFTRKVNQIENFQFDDIQLIDYNPYPNIVTKMIA